MYLAGDIPAFVMYCVNGESGSSLLIESTDSMIYINIYIYIAVELTRKLASLAIIDMYLVYNIYGNSKLGEK